MIKVEKSEIFGWEAAVRGMRNPMNSWTKSDSYYESDYDVKNEIDCLVFKVGRNDIDLMKRLCNAGTDHRKYLRMITVYCDITAPLYWWKEFDTYKVGTVANSCSTMHKIQAKEFTLDDFSHEHIFNNETLINSNQQFSSTIPHQVLCSIINCLNGAREKYLETKDKKYWWQMIQLLPSSYNQKRTVMMNYEVIANMYKSRKNHKLDEWHTLCDWVKELPYSELITMEDE